jgi:hypothetical protein
MRSGPGGAAVSINSDITLCDEGENAVISQQTESRGVTALLLLECFPLLLLENASPSCGCTDEEIYRNQVDGHDARTRKRRY